MHHCLPALREAGGGEVVTFSGGGATVAAARYDAYAASKAGGGPADREPGRELRDDGVTINAVAPGFVATRMQEATLAAGPERAGEDYYARTERQVSRAACRPRPRPSSPRSCSPATRRRSAGS